MSLPHDHRLVELKHYMLDIAEMLTRYWVMPESDPLYRILLQELKTSTDRGAILTSLRALCRISMNLPDNNDLEGVPLAIINKLSNYLLLEDEELVSASLDFLYQYTAVPKNVAILLANAESVECPIAPLVKDLSRLLRHGENEIQIKSLLQQAIAEVPAETIPSVPADLMRQLLQKDEPERSNLWLKCVFEEHKDSEITQIALWQAYQSRFTPYSHGGGVPNAPGLLPAAEFIKNVSIIFENATAQVVNGPSSKFIIKGIRPRRIPVDLRQHVYIQCLWRPPSDPKPCNEYFPDVRFLRAHINATHLNIPVGYTKEDGYPIFDISAADQVVQNLDCHWNGTCHRFTTRNKHPVKEATQLNLALHMGIHMEPYEPKYLKAQRLKRSPTATTSTTSEQQQHIVPPKSFHPNTLGPRGMHDPRILADSETGKPLPRSAIPEE
ncbi:MAG: hypothetical protein Q9222_007626, partial [Ikaeria aurantiellina]